MTVGTGRGRGFRLARAVFFTAAGVAVSYFGAALALLICLAFSKPTTVREGTLINALTFGLSLDLFRKLFAKFGRV